ncbi:hypothetical protein FM737_004394 [Escherichia marmotae]|nr:hypothetical protein A1SC_01853 [Escherichia sp. KTE52]KAF3708771.1 hypothetical protein FM737_004394 [Escherichia marmotae]
MLASQDGCPAGVTDVNVRIFDQTVHSLFPLVAQES